MTGPTRAMRQDPIGAEAPFGKGDPAPADRVNAAAIPSRPLRAATGED
jgi:hypothetical protein